MLDKGDLPVQPRPLHPKIQHLTDNHFQKLNLAFPELQRLYVLYERCTTVDEVQLYVANLLFCTTGVRPSSVFGALELSIEERSNRSALRWSNLRFFFSKHGSVVEVHYRTLKRHNGVFRTFRNSRQATSTPFTPHSCRGNVLCRPCRTPIHPCNCKRIIPLVNQ